MTKKQLIISAIVVVIILLIYGNWESIKAWFNPSPLIVPDAATPEARRIALVTFNDTRRGYGDRPIDNMAQQGIYNAIKADA